MKNLNLFGKGQMTKMWDLTGAKLWLQVVTELKNRDLHDLFIACVDGLKGFPEAIETVYPKNVSTAVYRSYGAP